MQTRSDTVFIFNWRWSVGDIRCAFPIKSFGSSMGVEKLEARRVMQTEENVWLKKGPSLSLKQMFLGWLIVWLVFSSLDWLIARREPADWHFPAQVRVETAIGTFEPRRTYRSNPPYKFRTHAGATIYLRCYPTNRFNDCIEHSGFDVSNGASHPAKIDFLQIWRSSSKEWQPFVLSVSAGGLTFMTVTKRLADLRAEEMRSIRSASEPNWYLIITELLVGLPVAITGFLLLLRKMRK